MLNFGSVTPIDGLVKPFDTKFQIPKLSARSQMDDTKKDQIHLNSTIPASSSIQLSSLMSSQTQSGSTSTPNSGENATKMLMDFFAGKEKYPYSLSKYSADLVNVNQMNLPYSMTSLAKMGIRTSTSPKYVSDMHVNKEVNLFKSTSSDAVSNVPKDFRDKHFSTSNPSTPTNVIAPPFPSPIIQHRSLENSPSHPSPSESPKLNNFAINQSMRPPSAPPTSNLHSTSSQDSLKSTENALDFSSPSLSKSEQIKLLEQRTCMQNMHKSNPPSVQLHIVKSPVPSPMVPHSSSPCIDDELMDEASLVGIGSK